VASAQVKPPRHAKAIATPAKSCAEAVVVNRHEHLAARRSGTACCHGLDAASAHQGGLTYPVESVIERGLGRRSHRKCGKGTTVFFMQGALARD
jgi:hypothetical protein